MKGAKNVSGLIDSRTQYGRPGAGAPGQSGMCRHIFSHPDYDRRLWHLTRSADPDVREGRRALAGSPHCMAYRRWGIAPRPEDVLHVVLTTFWIVRLSGFCGGICLLRVGVCSFWDGGWVGSFGAWGGGGRRARVNDCGPEPSLRTAPASSSSLPLAVPSDSLGRIDSPRPPARPRARLWFRHFTVSGAGGVLGIFLPGGVEMEDLAGSPKKAARAAVFGI